MRDSQNIDFLNRKSINSEPIKLKIQKANNLDLGIKNDILEKIDKIIDSQEIEWMQKNNEKDAVDYIVHRYKYENRDYLCRFFGWLLKKTIEKNPELEDIDYVLPVPMHWFKKLRRGYNQSELLAEVIARETGKNVLKNCLTREKALIKYS